MTAPPNQDIYPPDRNLSPVRIVLLYAFIGIAWIVFSDTVTSWLVTDVHQFGNIGILKGILFIFATAGLPYLLIRNYAVQLRSSQKTFHLAEQEVKKLAYYDRETGLPNHNLLLDRLNQVIAFNNRRVIEES